MEPTDSAQDKPVDVTADAVQPAQDEEQPQQVQPQEKHVEQVEQKPAEATVESNEPAQSQQPPAQQSEQAEKQPQPQQPPAKVNATVAQPQSTRDRYNRQSLGPSLNTSVTKVRMNLARGGKRAPSTLHALAPAQIHAAQHHAML